MISGSWGKIGCSMASFSFLMIFCALFEIFFKSGCFSYTSLIVSMMADGFFLSIAVLRCMKSVYDEAAFSLFSQERLGRICVRLTGCGSYLGMGFSIFFINFLGCAWLSMPLEASILKTCMPSPNSQREGALWANNCCPLVGSLGLRLLINGRFIQFLCNIRQLYKLNGL